MCKCWENGLRANMNYAELREFVRQEKYCTSLKNRTYGIGYICPTVMKEMRRAEVGRTYQEQRAKQLRKEGYSEKQIESKLINSKKKARHQKVAEPEIDFENEGLAVSPPKRKRARIRANA